LVDIKDIRYFIAIVEGRSMSQAAKDLFVSQPALSLIVKKLETEFGTKLFTRKGNSLELTVAGEHLLKKGRQILEEHESLISDIQGLTAEKKESISFGISSFYSCRYVPDLFRHYGKHLPSVHLQPLEMGSAWLEQAIIDGEVEFGFVPEVPRREELAYRTIDVEEFLLAVPKEDPVNRYAVVSAERSYIDFKHVMHMPFILHKSGSKSSLLTDRLFKHFNFKPKVIYETANREMMSALAGVGVGVCILPEIMASSKNVKDAPNFYRIAGIDMTRNYSVVYRPSKKFSALEEQLIDILTHFIRQMKIDALEAMK